MDFVIEELSIERYTNIARKDYIKRKRKIHYCFIGNSKLKLNSNNLN